MPSRELPDTNASRVELDQRARDSRLGLERIERLLVHPDAAMGAGSGENTSGAQPSAREGKR
jgi:hypothetical protein